MQGKKHGQGVPHYPKPGLSRQGKETEFENDRIVLALLLSAIKYKGEASTVDSKQVLPHQQEMLSHPNSQVRKSKRKGVLAQGHSE